MSTALVESVDIVCGGADDVLIGSAGVFVGPGSRCATIAGMIGSALSLIGLPGTLGTLKYGVVGDLGFGGSFNVEM